VRGAAILLVMVFHFSLMSADGSRLSDLVVKCALLGRCGVDLFFVLSGFLITGLLFDAKGSTGFYRTFYCRRLLRIFPLYYLALAIFVLLFPRLPGHQFERYAPAVDHQAWLWLHATNIGQVVMGFGSFGDARHLWSLAVEEHFYLVWPTVVLLSGRKMLMRICGGIVIGSLALRIILMCGGNNVLACYVLTPCRLDQLAMGAFIALAARGPAGFAPLLGLARWLTPLSFISLLGILILRGRQHDIEHDVFMPTIGYSVVGIFFAGCLVLAISAPARSLVPRLTHLSTLRMFGRYSYALYIFHFAVFSLVLTLLPHGHSSSLRFGLTCLPLLTLCTLLSLGLAWLSWNLWEKHFLRLKRYVPYQPARSSRRFYGSEDGVDPTDFTPPSHEFIATRSTRPDGASSR
jgi:peptidoglycan/LPS O-acetylase OafA/YrhL